MELIQQEINPKLKRNTNRYSNGKIYKIVNDIDDTFYIGSTCLALSKRFYVHKIDAKKKPQYCHKHFNTIGWDSVKIILIENVNVKTREELLKKEQYYIDNLKPLLNKNRAYTNCQHGKIHSICKDCGGTSICPHNKRKTHCRDCGGSQICEHNKQKSICKDCGGSQICQHNKQKSICKDCGGSQICAHNKRKAHCKDCGGTQICEHNRIKPSCKECNKDKYFCRECNVSLSSKTMFKYHKMKTMKHDKKAIEYWKTKFNEVVNEL